MPLRLMEVVAPADALDRALPLVMERDPRGVWVSDLADGSRLARILLETADTEGFSDLLRRELGRSEGFHLLLIPVEASLPAPPAPGGEPAAEPEADARPVRISRDELYQDVAGAAELSRRYLVSVALSTVVAAVGLMRGDVAIIIGAMVIAPLLAPNMALALAVTLGDLDLGKGALKANVGGVAVAFALSLAMGLGTTFDPGVEEIVARTRVSLPDIAVALAAGAAGTMAYTGGLPTAIVGVMVAVALLPPLVVTGLLLGAGETAAATGALVLLVTNVTCVNLAAVATFLAQRVGPRTWWEAATARRAVRVAMAIWVALLAVLAIVIYLLASGGTDAVSAR